MEIEKAKEINSSQLWEEVTKEIRNRINNEMAKLRHCSPDELVEIQMRVNLYEEIIRLPADVIERES